MPEVNRQTPPKKLMQRRLSVMDRIKPLSTNRTNAIKIAFYGQSGTGKTTLWSTFPKPILAVVCSGGKGAGELLSIDPEEMGKVISEVEIYESKEVKQLARGLLKRSQGFATVVLDHATGLQDMCIKEILGLQEMPEQLNWGFAAQEEWGQCALQCKEYMRSLLDLQCNVVIIAQERSNLEEANFGDIISPQVGLGVTPSVARWLNPAVDYICQTFIREKTIKKKVESTDSKGKKVVNIEVHAVPDEVDYCLRTAPSAIFKTKFRAPKGKLKLPKEIVDPDYNKLMEVIRGIKTA